MPARPLDYFNDRVGPGGRGSTANVVAAVASAILPGLGQLAQGRVGAAVFFLALDLLLWVFCLGWVMHIWACIDAALWEPDA